MTGRRHRPGHAGRVPTLRSLRHAALLAVPVLNLAFRPIDCADKRREEFAAAAQERDAIAGDETVHRGRRAVSNLAASAA